jgi:cytochrome c oxidase assembly protein subunit 11
MSDSSGQSQNSKLVMKLVFAVIGMFGFGFALIPLYDVLCDLTGINGKTSDTAAVYESVLIDESRLVTVDLITRTN